MKPSKNIIIKTALWYLYSQQEFVYVADAGIIEPAGKSRRMGIDDSGRLQFTNWLYGDVDLNVTQARAMGEAKGKDYIPLAPSFTSIGGLTVKTRNSFSSSLRYRLIGDRPANETNSVRTEGYFLMDAVLNLSLEEI